MNILNHNQPNLGNLSITFNAVRFYWKAIGKIAPAVGLPPFVS